MRPDLAGARMVSALASAYQNNQDSHRKMYNHLQADDESGDDGMSSPAVNSADQSLHVDQLYTRLAADRAAAARIALRHAHAADELLAQSAQALEDAAGTLTLASEMYAEDRERFSELLSQQATAMVVLAAQFEQAADLARTEHGCDR